jgi:hypothetical protein
MDPLWLPACTGYPGADNNSDNNNYDRGDSHGSLSLIVKGKRSHEVCPTIKISTNVKYLFDFVKGKITFFFVNHL